MKVVHTSQMEWEAGLNKGPFENRRKALGGDKQLSCGLWELAPGKKSFPFHMHHVTEEALYVISGTAQVRDNDGLTPIGPGDFVSFPPGGSAHQLVNDGKEPLVYIGIAANPGAIDLVEYPDSDKIASRTGPPPNGKRFIFKKKDQADYFDGEL